MHPDPDQPAVATRVAAAADACRVTSTSAMPPMVVLVPTHDRTALLRRTLDSLQACDAPAGREVRVLVVENGKRMGAEALVADRNSWLRFDYLFHEQANKSAALNAAVALLPGCLLVFLDDDVRVDRALLQQYSGAAGTLLQGAFFGGALEIDYEVEPEPWLVKHLPFSAKGWHPEIYEPPGPRMRFFGANWAAFADDITAAGGFDAGVGPGSALGATGQETDMQMRLVQKRLQEVYVREAVVWHWVPRDRSSPQWAIERGRKMATSAALWYSEKEAGTRLLGVPRWLAVKTLASGATLLLTLFSPSEQRRFEARLAWNQQLGALKGFKQRSRLEREGANWRGRPSP